ncbi:MAG TPA: AMP-binding protein, partial [Pelomicrobium sp.]|nr:AMP-binding protein [Pelomicrobium sp.]
MDQPQATHDTLQTLVEQLERRGDAPALVALHKEGLECWSARELAQAAKDVARMLRGAGVEPKQAVALFADNSPQWVAAALGIAEAGAVVAPFDVQLGDKVLRHVLEDSEARLVFTTSDRAERLQELAPKIELRLLDEDDGERSWKAAAAEGGEPVAVGPGDPAALFYTSGTTGPPKGVPLTHRNLAFQLESVREAKLVTEDDRALVPLPLHHVYPFVIGMLVPLALGVPVILPHALTGPEVVRAIREGEATVVIGVPRLYRAMLSGIESRATSAGRIAGLLFRALLGVSIAARRVGLKPGRRLFARLHERVGPRLRLLASGGAPLGPELARKLQALGWDVAIGYGLTETAPLITIRMPDDDAPGSVGQPIRGVEVRIDREAAPGDDGDARQGEVLVRGPNVFDGYRNLPEKTREALDDDGWFRTGDLGYEERDGFLYLTGRASEVLVTEGGKNIQPDEVEEAYLEQPALREMAVLMKDDRLVALVVPDSRHLRGRDEEGMREAVQEAITAGGRALPSYQRVSDFAITRESLPRTRLGKLRRHLLPDRYDEAKAGKERAGGPVSPEEMSGEDRALVSDPAAGAVWEWLAQRYANQPLTPDTSLQMDLGIDSLEWVNLTLEVSQRAGVELTEDAIAEVETVRDLLQQVAQAGEGEGPDLR